jgi:FKBP-type peptidyl-prolyl cis-trans isomerase FklB
MLVCTAFFILHSSFFISCSEEDAVEDEYANWEQRNDAFFASLDDSLRHDAASWMKLKSYSLDESTTGKATDYIYAKVIRQGTGTDSPMFTDSLRVSYQGRLIPTASYPQGYVFDGTAYGKYNDATNATKKMVMVSSGYESLIPGWITALLHMHRGDYWRVYIPSELAYGEQEKSSIPKHSMLIFELTLVDFSPAGHPMNAWSARSYTSEPE